MTGYEMRPNQLKTWSDVSIYARFIPHVSPGFKFGQKRCQLKANG